MGTPTHHFPRPSRAGATIGIVAALLVVAVLQPGSAGGGAHALEPRANAAALIATTTTTLFPVAHPDASIPPVEAGLAPVISRIKTTQPVVFLTIDDGLVKQPLELALLQQNRVRASLFLANLFIHNNPGFFVDFTRAGSLVEDHTVTHPNMRTLTYAQQKQEICGMADLEQQEFGRRPILFRPPGGAYNTDTQRAAAACGMRAVVNWIAKVDGGAVQYQLAPHLRPGDIVLMHFRSTFAADFAAFVNAMQAAGLHTELLEDWVSPPPKNWSGGGDLNSRPLRPERSALPS